MIVVNLFGAPGAGKTGVTHGIVSRLKRRGMEVDCVLELARKLHYTKNTFMLQDELHLLADKNTRLNELREGGIKIAVTDGPVLASIVYRDEGYFPAFDQMAREVHNAFDNINFYIPGVRDHFSVNGRGQANREEASRRGTEIIDMLRREGQEVHLLNPAADMEEEAELFILRQLELRVSAKIGKRHLQAI